MKSQPVVLLLLAAFLAGCANQPGSNADLSKLAAAAPPARRAPSPFSVVTGPDGSRRLLANVGFILSPMRDEARLELHASLNPDCSDRDGVDIRVTVPPQHGTATVRHEAGFLDLPPRSPNYKCIGQKHDGVRVVYRREPGFVGTDSLTYDVYFPSGVSYVIHYTIVSQ